MSEGQRDDLTTVGFNDEATYDGRVFHVQTEVVNRGGLFIRTTVHEGGIIVVSRTTTHEQSTATRATTEAAARRQHDNVLGDVRRGVVN